MREEVKIAVPFEIKTISDDGKIIGYGAVFNNVDLGYDRIESGAFKSSIRGRKTIPMLWQHYSDEPIGVWHKFQEDDTGLMVEGQLNLSRDSGQADVPMAYKARALAKQGAVTGLSIGFFPKDFRYEGDIRVLEKVELLEVSMATFPMNPLAQIVDAKDLLTNKGFEQAMRERLGVSRKAAEAIRLHGQEGLRNQYDGARKAGDDHDSYSRQSGSSGLSDSLGRLLKAIEG